LEKKLQENRIAYQSVFETDNVGTLKRVIESGLGWGFLPSHSIRKQVRTGRLLHVQTDELKYSVDVFMYFRKNSGREQMVDILYRALQQQGLN
jgi:DNA-binding transcriptional LysR family regulator